MPSSSLTSNTGSTSAAGDLTSIRVCWPPEPGTSPSGWAFFLRCLTSASRGVFGGCELISVNHGPLLVFIRPRPVSRPARVSFLC
jgi:hypothetical protein